VPFLSDQSDFAVKIKVIIMLPASIKKNDRLARILIYIVSVVVFVAVVILSRVKLELNLGFDVHVFARINAVINTIVSFLLLVGLLAVLKGNYHLHKKVMLTAILFSTVFLVSYICHHLFSGIFFHFNQSYFSGCSHPSIYSFHFIQGFNR
jgi:uncharacterized membrane protein YozB (DUF420 family)